MARRLLVMAHWRKDPQEIRSYSDDELEAMEQAFLLLEKRQTETLETIAGTLLGTTWDVEALLEAEKAKGKGKRHSSGAEFTWSLRDKRQKLFVPLIFFLTQNPKLMKQLQSMAMDLRKSQRKDPSMLNVPTWYGKKGKEEKIELVDLSASSKEEFLRWARSVKDK